MAHSHTVRLPPGALRTCGAPCVAQVKGGGRYAYQHVSSLTAGAPALPTEAETEAEIAAAPVTDSNRQ